MQAAQHVQDAEYVRQAFRQVHGRDPSLSERQGIQSVGAHESGGGRYWPEQGAGSFNIGAVQAGQPPCGPNAWLWEDSHPTAEGQVKFPICFKSYASPADGWADVVKLLTTNRPVTWQAMKNGDLHGMAQNMRDSVYYEGFGATREQQVAGYEGALATMVAEIAAANGEPVAISSSGGTAGSKLAQLGVLLLGLAGGIAIASFVMPELEDAF